MSGNNKWIVVIVLYCPLIEQVLNVLVIFITLPKFKQDTWNCKVVCQSTWSFINNILEVVFHVSFFCWLWTSRCYIPPKPLCCKYWWLFSLFRQQCTEKRLLSSCWLFQHGHFLFLRHKVALFAAGHFWWTKWWL